MAYNAQGTALRKAGKPKEAILAFLHVHLTYDPPPDLDAEAVANLERLFTETHKPKHAREMREILNEKYRNSRWAKGVSMLWTRKPVGLAAHSWDAVVVVFLFLSVALGP